MAYLYRHIRLDKNVPFYIGIAEDRNGKYARAFERGNRRNRFWQAVIKKTAYEVEILLENLSWEVACVKEKEFIALYKRVNDGGTLVNFTLGGDGIQGYTHTEATKKLITEAGYLRPKQSLETCLKKSLAKKGKSFSPTHKQNLSKALKGRKRSLEARLKQSQTLQKLKASRIINQALE